jgi:hypothetical protein
MRGVVLAIVLAPASVDESVVLVRSHRIPVLARGELDELRRRLLRPPASFGAEPIPLWAGPVPWAFIPPFPPPLKSEPVGNSVQPPASPRAEPIPLWSGPVPWVYIPPFPPLRPEPARNAEPTGLTARSLGIIPVRLELPVSGSPAP